jgi:hypothetical protein
MERQHDRRNQ